MHVALCLLYGILYWVILINKMAVDIAKQFGENVRKYRVMRKLSQEELANRAELHRTQITLIESGKRCPRLDTIYKLATALNIKPEKLLPDLK
jgi:transcriptional regulator with XRE-family HTH domain